MWFLLPFTRTVSTTTTTMLAAVAIALLACEWMLAAAALATIGSFDDGFTLLAGSLYVRKAALTTAVRMAVRVF